MRRFGAKLAFVHRALWQRDATYRWAALLGPPPLLGVALAAVVLAGLHWRAAGGPAQGSDAPWARWTRPVTRDGQPFSEPQQPVPRTDATGRYVGYEPGWHGVIQPLTVDASMDPRVTNTVLSTFGVGQPAVPLARIVDAGPPAGLFVGTVNAFFVAASPGIYGFSARLARSGTQSADCLLWLETPKHRMLRNVNLNAGGQAVLAYETTSFRLEPGLLHVLMAVGCWRGDRMVSAGEATLLVQHPGQGAPLPVPADELISALPQSPGRAPDPSIAPGRP